MTTTIAKYDITEARFLIERAGLEEAQAQTRVVYAVLSSYTRRIHLTDATREATGLPILQPGDYRKAARQLTAIGLLVRHTPDQYSAAVHDVWLYQVVRLLRCRLSCAHHRPGFPSRWVRLSLPDYELTPEHRQLRTLLPIALRHERHDRYRDTIRVLTELVQSDDGQWVYFGRSPAADLLAKHGRIDAKGDGYYRANKEYDVREMREVYRQLAAEQEQ